MNVLVGKEVFFSSTLIDWYLEYGRVFSWRNTDDAFHFLIAEILLRQSGAWKVEGPYNRLTKIFSTPEKMAKANTCEILRIIQPLGLHERASLLINIAKTLLKDFGGKVPQNYSDLISIKGIGQYTANALLCFYFKQKVPIVDESIKRLFSRYFSFHSNKPAHSDKNLWGFANNLLPAYKYVEYNYALIDLSFAVCKNQKLQCNLCPVSKRCDKYNQACIETSH